jgi:hypothetical protein
MRRCTGLLVVLCFALEARAHDGPRFWIGNLCNEIATYTSDNDLNPLVYPPARLFATDLTPFFGVYTTQFPGFEVRRSGGNVASGTTFGFNIAGPLLWYDADLDRFLTVQQEFGPPEPGPVPQLALSLGSNVRVTGNGPVTGFAFFTFHQVGDHSHLSFTLLGDGSNPVDGPSGVYALALQLTSGGLVTSDVFYLLLRKGVTSADPLFLAAQEAARASLAIPGDHDVDGDADLHDLAEFQGCFTGAGSFALECACAFSDLDGDSDVDVDDAEAITSGLTGPAE